MESKKKFSGKQQTLSAFFEKSNAKKARLEESEDPTTKQGTTETLLESDIPNASTSKVAATESKVPTRKFQANWLIDFEWLEFDEDLNSMSCKYCRAKPTTAGKTDFVSGSTSFKRESLSSHSKSKRHIACRDSVINSSTDVQGTAIGKGFLKQTERDKEAENFELSVKMNTAYCIAKEELSFTHMKALVLLQKKNGLDISPTYDNDVR